MRAAQHSTGCPAFTIPSLKPSAVLWLQVEREVAIESGVLEDEVLTEVQGIEAAFSKVLSLFKK
jgi:hypothetical protein